MSVKVTRDEFDDAVSTAVLGDVSVMYHGSLEKVSIYVADESDMHKFDFTPDQLVSLGEVITDIGRRNA